MALLEAPAAHPIVHEHVHDEPAPARRSLNTPGVWALTLLVITGVAFGLYRGLWRFASLLDLQRIALAAGLGALLNPVGLVMLQMQAIVPRSVAGSVK